jgi:hypothetical protein
MMIRSRRLSFLVMVPAISIYLHFLVCVPFIYHNAPAPRISTLAARRFAIKMLPDRSGIRLPFPRGRAIT